VWAAALSFLLQFTTRLAAPVATPHRSLTEVQPA
jgi:hypothetical protein